MENSGWLVDWLIDSDTLRCEQFWCHAVSLPVRPFSIPPSSTPLHCLCPPQFHSALPFQLAPFWLLQRSAAATCRIWIPAPMALPSFCPTIHTRNRQTIITAFLPTNNSMSRKWLVLHTHTHISRKFNKGDSHIEMHRSWWNPLTRNFWRLLHQKVL